MKHLHVDDRDWQEGKGYRKKRLLDSAPLPAEVSFIQEVRFSKGSTIPAHYHRTQTEIFYVLARGSMVINDEEIRMEAGDVVVCEPGEVHGMPLVEEDFAFLVMKIDHREDDTVWL